MRGLGRGSERCALTKRGRPTMMCKDFRKGRELMGFRDDQRDIKAVSKTKRAGFWR